MQSRSRNFANILILGISLLLVLPKSADARQSEFESWFSLTVTPFVARQLATHPRFKGELVRFVVFVDDKPAPLSDAFSLSLRDRLADVAIDVPGLRVAGPTKPDATTLDCTRDAAHYYVGLQISETSGNEYRIDLRALDLEDRSWVAGFSLSWLGTMTKSQRRAYERPQSDTYFQGQRDVPFAATQPDLLASNLAYDLGCSLLRQVAGEYVVLVDDQTDLNTPLSGVVELVSNNLAGKQALQLTHDPERANAVLRGKAHSVDDNLHQYWITVSPLDSSSELPTLSASAYVQIPTSMQARQIVPRSAHDVVSSLRIVEMNGRRACDFNADNCYAMQIKTSEDAVVFFLNHQRNHGLVRLSGRDCAQRTDARIARANEALHQPLPLHTLMHDATSTADNWSLNPDADTYYAIAVSDTKAARVLSKHLQKLPQRCTDSVRFGFEGARLENWLDEFSSALLDWQPYVDWQAIHVKNVF